MENVPKTIGPYEIRGKIGSGGMGIVYLGWDARLNRQVAIKTLWPALAENPEARERFVREARAAAAISHPNVTQIYDIGEDDGRVYFAMEYLEGETLQQMLIRQGGIAAGEAISLARQAARGLKAAEERGIIHRDIKPSNLVLTNDGTLKVTDFGLAKHQVADSSLTMQGQFIGTPDYISPEQAQGETLDARSDIYSLGATLFEMLGGRPPFIGATPVAVVVQHLREPVPSLRHANPEVPVPLAALIQRMLAKRPGARPQGYDELIAQLDRIESHEVPVTTLPDVAGSVVVDDVRSGFASRLLVFAFIGLMFVVGVGTLVGRQKSDPPRTVERPSTGEVARASETEQAPLARSTPAPAPAGSNAGAPPTAPLMRMLKAGQAKLEFIDASQEITADGRLRVSGAVTNTGDGTATGIKVRVALTDEVNQVVESTEVPVSPSRLAQGETGNYEVFFAQPPVRVQVRLEMNWFS